MAVLGKLNSDQLKEIATSLRLIALGQLVYFGYTGLSKGPWWRILPSVLATVVLMSVALYVLAFFEEKARALQ
jgi:hypothetical protein